DPRPSVRTRLTNTISRSRRSGGEQALELVGVDRLDQVRVEAGVEGLPAVVDPPVARERYEKGLAARRRPHLLRHLVAVEARKADVDEGDLGAMFQEQLDRPRTVLRLLHDVTPELEEGPERQPVIRVVFDDENPTCERGRRPHFSYPTAACGYHQRCPGATASRLFGGRTVLASEPRRP